MMAYRPEFLEGLALIAKAATAAVKSGGTPPILVGGAAVEFFTGGAITSGDFDLWTASENLLRRNLLIVGFKDEDRRGHLARGFYHPDLDMGVELVSGTLFDGRCDRSRLVMATIGDAAIHLPPVEDLIADRMGQYNSAPRKVPAMREQAAILYLLADDLDEAYLERRIREDTAGDFGLSDLKEAAHELSHDHD
ncbi:hypothetical protein [Zavarzinia aquatilis]|uniref:Uncharacterized protein n=1 Tax=Zavarzinia aquatilis TaxID=2211142 RepID=A0A317DZU2_9PROT|nr:hypothetical protein [Zavarzinia aquatilis]PWR18425.1 hypothetical protein DKG74_19460 [Zavarzinia aquatilis]